MSTYAEFQTRVRRELEEETATVWSADSILAWTNDAIFDLSRKLRFRTDEWSQDTVIGQNTYAVPDYTTEVIACYYDSSKLTKLSPREFYDYHVAHQDNGIPVYYAVFDDCVHLTPAPSEVKSLRFMRYYRQTPIASTASVATMPWGGQYDELLSYYVKARAWEQVPDFDQVTMNDNMYQRGSANAILNEYNDFTGDYFIQPVEIW